MRASHAHLWFPYCVLILVGALFACSPAPTPVAIVPTATILPVTETPTTTPTRATNTPRPTATVSITITGDAPTSTPTGIQPILPSTAPIDATEITRLSADLADRLSISPTRVQLVSVELARWDLQSLGCEILTTEDILARGLDSIQVVAGMRYVLLVGDTLYEYHTVSASGRFVLCDGRQTISDDLLIAVDPLAAETFRSVQLLLASELDLSTRLIQLVTMRPVTWTDTSLGCPQAGQTYADVQIQGYYMVVSVGGDNYIYHSDSIDIYPCPIEQSVLPDEAEVEATPET